MKTLVAAILLACSLLPAQATSVNCLPSDFGGSGSVLVYSKNSVGRWAGWWCPGESTVHVFACRTASCPTGSSIASKLQRLWDYPSAPTLNEMAYSLPAPDTLKDVWQPELYKLLAVKPK